MKSESWYSSPVSHLATRMVPPGGAQPGRPTAASRLPPRSAASRLFRPLLSALAAAAPQQPPEQQPQPRAGPSRHTASLRSLSRCFISLQPRSLPLALGSLAPLPAPAPPSEALSSGPAPREEATQPSRNGANIATPSRARAGLSPPPGTRPGQSAGGAARARPPAGSPAPGPQPSGALGERSPRAPAAGVQQAEEPEAQLDTTPVPAKPSMDTSCEAEVRIGDGRVRFSVLIMK